jgi:hypothetical protein
MSLSSHHINKIINVLGVDLTQHHYLPHPYDKFFIGQNNIELIPTNSQNLSMSLVLWFLNMKKIKYPNNPFGILHEHYPTIKLLRKHNMNLIHATLSAFGIKSKSTIKMINQHPTISCYTIAFWFHLLGHDYFIQLDKKMFEKQTSITHLIHDVLFRFNIEFVKSNDMLNNPQLWKQINTILTKHEKYQIFNIMRSLDFDLDKLSIVEIADHCKMKRDLLEFNDVVKMKARNLSEFKIEHVLWTDKLYNYRKNKTIQYFYTKTFLENIETPQHIYDEIGNVETYYPVVLKQDNDYEQESAIQSHCVKSYINNFTSIIISIRKGNPQNYDRVTCEYRYENSSNRFVSIQKKYKANSVPKDYFKPVLENIDKLLEDFAKKYEYTRPTVIETNKHNQHKKVLYSNPIYSEDGVLVQGNSYDEFDI